jgi:hypothetical protein
VQWLTAAWVDVWSNKEAQKHARKVNDTKLQQQVVLFLVTVLLWPHVATKLYSCFEMGHDCR